MFKILRIQNLILIESAEIHFQDGLNVLSGETGSGKSAIMEGLKAVLGFRGDSNLIRKGETKASIEASIDLSSSKLLELLHQGGIEHSLDEELIIRREIYASGKSRAFINQQMVQISFLKQFGDTLVSIVGQHANQQLFDLDQHRHLLDTFGNLHEMRESFAKNFKEEKQLLQNLHEMKINESMRLRELKLCFAEIEELENAKLKEAEEHELFEEYQLLATAEERMQTADEICQLLTAEKSPLVTLRRHKNSFDALFKQDVKVGELAETYNHALLELEDVAHELKQYVNKLEVDPGRLNHLNERLTFLNRLKKKYGSTCLDMLRYLEERKKRAAFLENADIYIEDLEKRIELLQIKTRKELQELSEKRVKSANRLEKAITEELHQLNMPKAQFQIILEKHEPNFFGQDRVEFFLQPNVGENPVSIRECASGGELSRVLLALKTLLADRDGKLAIVFDEVDANIGGATASVIGEKLQALGSACQVVCITHFPQVARFANHHLQITKNERDGRTITLVSPLDEKGRKQEILRMQGELVPCQT